MMGDIDTLQVIPITQNVEWFSRRLPPRVEHMCSDNIRDQHQQLLRQGMEEPAGNHSNNQRKISEGYSRTESDDY